MLRSTILRLVESYSIAFQVMIWGVVPPRQVLLAENAVALMSTASIVRSGMCKIHAFRYHGLEPFYVSVLVWVSAVVGVLLGPFVLHVHGVLHTFWSMADKDFAFPGMYLQYLFDFAQGLILPECPGTPKTAFAMKCITAGFAHPKIYLERPAGCPVFAKPAFGSRGRGHLRLEADEDCK